MDQVIARTSVADEMDFGDGLEFADAGLRAATPAADSNALDDFFTQFEEFGELLTAAVGR